jgi:hypothetical protein
MFLLTWVLLVLQKSKPYYFAASFPVMMAAGGVAWERWTEGRRWRWGRWAMTTLLLAGLVVFMPLALPVLSPEGVDAYQKKLGMVPNTGEVGHDAELPQYFSDRFGWEEMARTVSGVYRSLPAGERESCVALGSNYGSAGALEHWARRYELPPAFSTHNSFWLWGPPPIDESTVVITVNISEERAEEYFRDCEEAAVSETPFAEERPFVVRVCRGLLRPIKEIWPEVRTFI